MKKEGGINRKKAWHGRIMALDLQKPLRAGAETGSIHCPEPLAKWKGQNTCMSPQEHVKENQHVFLRLTMAY